MDSVQPIHSIYTLYIYIYIHPLVNVYIVFFRSAMQPILGYTSAAAFPKQVAISISGKETTDHKQKRICLFGETLLTCT